MDSNSRIIKSNQNDVHPDLEQYVEKYLSHPFQRPIPDFALELFNDLDELVKRDGRPVILDSGCGVGQSTLVLAKQFPNYLVLGIDKSLKRLDKNFSYQNVEAPNAKLVRADLIDFWPLVVKAGWKVDKHFILYPNPWPKKRDVKKRFHAHPVIVDLLKTSPHFELRSNWSIYLQEFAMVAEIILGAKAEVKEFTPDEPVTPFEKKYQQSGHKLYRLVVEKTRGVGSA